MTKYFFLTLSFLLLVPASSLSGREPQASSPRPKEFGVCAACHKVEKGLPGALGPNLFGIANRKAGSAQGYKYSPAMKNSGVRWNRASLTGFIMEPRKTVPGTRMFYGGMKNRASAEAIADYILSLK